MLNPPKCNSCSAPEFATNAEFHKHWIACPGRIAAGYIPMPTEMALEKISQYRKDAAELLSKADKLEAEVLSRASP